MLCWYPSFTTGKAKTQTSCYTFTKKAMRVGTIVKFSQALLTLIWVSRCSLLTFIWSLENIEGFDSHFQEEQFLYLAWIKSYWHYKLSIISSNANNFWPAQDIEIAPSGNTNRKPSEYACKIFFNYSKLCVISFFAKKVQFLPRKHASRCFSNEFLQSYRQESFDSDSFASQSRFDAYAYLMTHHGSY